MSGFFVGVFQLTFTNYSVLHIDKISIFRVYLFLVLARYDSDNTCYYISSLFEIFNSYRFGLKIIFSLSSFRNYQFKTYLPNTFLLIAYALQELALYLRLHTSKLSDVDQRYIGNLIHHHNYSSH